MERRYTFFVHMNATAAWLRLERSARAHIFQQIEEEIFARYPSVSVRLYDVEAFTAKCSDIAVFETAQLQDYYFLIEELRDSPVYTHPYFELVDIFPAIEGGFIEFESHQQTQEA